MSVADIIQRIRDRKSEKKALIRDMDNHNRAEEILSDRKLSANERELRRYIKENREESIKHELEKVKKFRQNDIDFGHNPLGTKNIMKESDFSVMKAKNLFAGSSMFASQNNKGMRLMR